MKTYVVIVCEQVAYAIDVQSRDNEVIKLKGNKLYLDYLLHLRQMIWLFFFLLVKVAWQMSLILNV